MLRLNNVPIWNLIDLKNEFSPIELFRQRDEFLRFAKVHCMVLSTRLTDSSQESYEAYYLTKEFWFNVLSGKWNIATQDDNSALWCFLNYRAQEELGDSSDEEESKIKADIEKEVSDAQLDDKLRYIENCISSNQSEANSLLSASLLAICEIAEVDARECRFSSLHQEEAESDNQQTNIELISGDENNTNKVIAVSLKASKKPYKFRAYDETNLTPGSVINTVCIEATPGVNKYDNVVMEFYNRHDILIATITIRPGEHRFATVTQGKLIGFLPAVSIENGCCVYRTGYNSQSTKIRIEDEQPRTISKFEPTSFVSLGKNGGAILIRDGKIVTDYCKVGMDHRTRLVLEMLLAGLNVAEIAHFGESVKVLTAEGKVYSILSRNGDNYVWQNVSLKAPEAENCVALSEEIRVEKSKTKNGDTLETVVSLDNSETAELMRSGECKINFR